MMEQEEIDNCRINPQASMITPDNATDKVTKHDEATFQNIESESQQLLIPCELICQEKKFRDKLEKAEKRSFHSCVSVQDSISEPIRAKRLKFGPENYSKRGNKNKMQKSLSEGRPNYFVAFKVSNEKILDRIREFQERMLSRSAKSENSVVNPANPPTTNVLTHALVPVHKMHFTLHVVQLQTDEHVNKATEALRSIYEKVKSEFIANPLHLEIKGLDHFNNSVLFAKINGFEEIGRVESLANLIKNEFNVMGFRGEEQPFKPHMTLAKLSKLKSHQKKKLRTFPKNIWREDEDMHFGHQHLEGIELLSMKETDKHTGYYKSIAQFCFNADTTSE